VVAGSNTVAVRDMSLVSVVCCEVDVSVSGCSLVRRNPTECGASDRDDEASIMRRPWPTVGGWALGWGDTWKDVIATLNCLMLISQHLP
jgi:hypothetical protein